MNFDECFVCGVTGKKVRLLEVISLKEKGVIKVCDSCAVREDMPILRRPTTFQLKEAEKSLKSSRVYEGLLSARKHKDDFGKSQYSADERRKTETTLKQIVDRNYKETVSHEKKPRPYLVDNFHWVIMRARTLKKITRQQLAKEIFESESAIKMAEQGILPEDDYRLINKLESFLGIKLIKDESKIKKSGFEEGFNDSENNKKTPARIIKFDPEAMNKITIADIKKMREEIKKNEITGFESEDKDIYINEGSEEFNEDIEEDIR